MPGYDDAMRRLRPLATGEQSPPDRQALTKIQVLPTMVTLGNLIAGVLAISYLQDAAAAPEKSLQFMERASWLLFAGMVCDALDGRIARLTGTATPFGAQIDSLADIVTFGVAPALLAKTALLDQFSWLHPRLLFALCAAYVIGACLRLARYNVESARTTTDRPSYVTKIFRGIPSPAAAGVLASLILLHSQHQFYHVTWLLIPLLPLLGFLMVSRMPYSHLINRHLEGVKPMTTIVLLALLVLLMVSFFEETVASAFVLYALSGPVLWLLNRVVGGPSWVVDEQGDEEPLPDDVANRATGA